MCFDLMWSMNSSLLRSLLTQMYWHLFQRHFFGECWSLSSIVFFISTSRFDARTDAAATVSTGEDRVALDVFRVTGRLDAELAVAVATAVGASLVSFEFTVIRLLSLLFMENTQLLLLLLPLVFIVRSTAAAAVAASLAGGRPRRRRMSVETSEASSSDEYDTEVDEKLE